MALLHGAMVKQDEQLVLRLSAPLRRELERLADGLPLAIYVRRILIDHAAARVIAREQKAEAAA